MEEYKKSILEYDSIKTAMMLSREEGIEEGIKEGLEITRKEIAKRCLQEGLSVDLISDITKLRIEQIKDLSKN
jgi:predicted transposase YdaD